MQTPYLFIGNIILIQIIGVLGFWGFELWGHDS